MRILILPQVEKSIKDEREEVLQDIFSFLARLTKGEQLSYPFVKPLFSIHLRLYEFRISARDGKYRLIYYIHLKDAIYVLHFFKKATMQMPSKEKKIIISRLKGIKRGQ